MFYSNAFVRNGIKYAFVINRELRCDNEQAKEEELSEEILYFMPADTPLVEKVRYTDIAEGIISFASSFDEDSNVKMVKTENYTYNFCRWEKDTWIVLVLDKYEYTYRSGRKEKKAFHAEIVSSIMKDMYRFYSLFNEPIESYLYKKTEDGKIVAKELVDLKLKLRLIKELEDQIKKNEVAETEETKKKTSLIPSLSKRIQELEELSPVPAIRENIFSMMRKYFVNIEWQHVHFLYAINAFTSIPMDQTTAIDIHIFMSTLLSQFPEVVAGCFLYDGFYMWSNMDKESQVLLSKFDQTNQDSMPSHYAQGTFLSDTEGRDITKIYLTLRDCDGTCENPERKPYYVMRYRYGKVVLLFLLDGNFDETPESLKSFEDDFSSITLKNIKEIHDDMMQKRQISERTFDNNFVIFFYDSKEKSLSTNLNVNRKDTLGVPVTTPVSPTDMINTIPSNILFLIDNIYCKLSDSDSFVETSERINDNEGVYGCKQHGNYLFAYKTGRDQYGAKMMIERMHHIVAKDYSYAFTLV